MAEAIAKFGGNRDRRPNPLVELYAGFGDAAPYVRIVKFRRNDAGKWSASGVNVSTTKLPDLIADLKAALETAEDQVLEA